MPLIEIEDDYLVTQVGSIVPADMDDEDLRDCMGMLCVEGADIREQLADPTRTGEAWRIRAQDALRYRVRDFEGCRVEAIRRGMRDLPDINPEREKARLDRVARFENSMAHLAMQERLREERKVTVKTGFSPGQLRHAELMLEVQRDRDRRAARKAAQALAYAAAESEAFRGKAACFVAAARKVMPVEDRRAVWNRAREMFPDDPCWRENRTEETSDHA